MNPFKLFAVYCLLLPGLARAGIPVIDSTNVVQTTITAVQEFAQTAKQVEEYTTQIQQYQAQLTNLLKPDQFIWGDAKQIIGSLLETIDSMKAIKQNYEDITSFLDQFQDVNSMLGNKCFQAGGCSPEEWLKFADSRLAASSNQQAAFKAAMQGLDAQQTQLENDADELANLQANAQTAEGELQATQYANQLLANIANQLLQMRALEVSAQNLIASRMQAQAEVEAQQQALKVQIHSGTFKKSDALDWKF